MFCCCFGTALNGHFSHFERSQSQGGAKTWDPQDNNQITHKQNLAASPACDPGQPQNNVGELFEQLPFNHSAMGVNLFKKILRAILRVQTLHVVQFIDIKACYP